MNYSPLSVTYQISHPPLAKTGGRCPRCLSKFDWDLCAAGFQCRRCGYLIPMKHVTAKLKAS